ncbi:MAG: radical SAM protein [bacterium]
MEACIIVTYRCNAKCYMCNTWQYPTRQEAEITPDIMARIPSGLKFLNITGGEPFLRKDLEEIIKTVLPKTARLVISTNGYFTDRILSLAEKYGNRIGIRISIEGLPAANDELRGIRDGFDHGLRTLLCLHDMGMKDIGFGITVSDRNARDMKELYRLAKAMRIEFATAATHNSYYFHKKDNGFQDPEMVAGEFEWLAEQMLKSRRVKEWFRAYFNTGLANYVRGGKRFLPCEVGTDVFFLDPCGDILPCNGLDEPLSMGNLKEQSFEEIWHGRRAEEVRASIRNCQKNCWMIGSAAPAMKKRIGIPLQWIIRKKLHLSTSHAPQKAHEC